MYVIVGMKKSVGDFTDRNSGQTFHYDNIKFYVVDDSHVEGIGQCAESIAVRSAICSDLYVPGSIGKRVNFAYNRYGKVQSVEIVGE